MPSDTPRSVEALHLDLMRRAGPTRRAQLAIQLSTSMIRGSRRAIARVHPELDERAVRLLWVEKHYGTTIAAAVRHRLGLLP